MSAAEYLPPLVTKLQGDASDLLAAFGEAEAAQKAYGKSTGKLGDDVTASMRKSSNAVNDFADLVEKRAKQGETAYATLRREIETTEGRIRSMRGEMQRGAGGSALYADLRKASDELERMKNLAKNMAPDLLQAGNDAGQGFGKGAAAGIGSVGPYVIAALVALAVLAAPAIGSAVASALTVGLGLGLIGVGALIAAKIGDKRVTNAFAGLGEQLKHMMLLAISGPFSYALVAGIKTIERYIPTLTGQLRGIFDQLAPLIKPLADALGKGLVGFLTGMNQAIKNSGPALEAFIATIPGVMTALGQFFATISSDGPAMVQFIQDAAKAIEGFLHGTAETVLWLEKAYKWLSDLHAKAVAGGWDTPQHAITTGVKKIGEGFTWLWGKIKEGSSAVAGWFSSTGSTVGDWFKRVWRDIAGWWDGVIAWAKGIPGKISGYVSALPGRVGDAFKALGHKIAYEFGYIGGLIVRFIAAIPGNVTRFLTQLWQRILIIFQTGKAMVIAELNALPGQIGALWNRLRNDAVTWGANLWASVAGWMRRTRDDAVAWIASAVDGIADWFQKLPGRVAEKIIALKAAITTWFKNAKDWLVDAGKDIVLGFVHGIESMWDWAVQKVKSLGHDISRGFKDALGIASPSKVFALAGDNVVAGFVLGIQRSTSRAVDAIASMSRGLTPAYAGGSGFTSAMASAITGSSSGGGYNGPSMVATTVTIDGRAILTATTPVAQRRKNRSGTTGVS